MSDTAKPPGFVEAPFVKDSLFAEGELPPLHVLQTSSARRIARAQIKNAEYNPRKIGIANRVKLEELLTKFGLVETLVWNERSGNLVGGHQRLSILDALSDSPNYSLIVSVVYLDDVNEKALNASLNAKGAQGEYDPEKLKALLNELEGQVELDLQDLFSSTEKELKKLTEKPKKKKQVVIDGTYEIVIKCKDEIEQRSIFNKLVEQGYECRVLTL